MRGDVSKDLSDIVFSDVGEGYGWGVLVALYVVEVGGRGVGEKGGGEDATFVFGAARQALRGLKWG